jgi:peptidoglycan hydrolase-like protein with peptidoglycan-binding domain
LYERLVVLFLCFVFIVSAGHPALFFSHRALAVSSRSSHCIVENQGQWDSSIHFFYNTSSGGIVFAETAMYIVSPAKPPIKHPFPFDSISPAGIQPSTIQYTYITSSSVIRAQTWSSIQYRDGTNGVDYLFYIEQDSLSCSITLSPYSSQKEDLMTFLNTLQKDPSKEPSTILAKSLQSTVTIDSYDNKSTSDETGKATLQTIHTNPLGDSWVGGAVLSPASQSQEIQSIKENYDAYIKRYRKDGTIAECILFGGSGWEEVMGIDVSNDGLVYCCGTTDSKDFPFTRNLSSSQSSQDTNVFTLIYNPSDQSSKALLLGGSDNDAALDIKVNARQDVLITGYTTSSDFPTTKRFVSPNQEAYQSNAFVVCIDTGDCSILNSTLVGGSQWDVSMGLSLDSLQNIYITGYTYSHDFPVTPLAYDTSHNGEKDAFVIRFTPDGNHMIFCTFLGGDSFDIGKAIACDWEGNVFVAGTTNSSSFPCSSRHVQNNLGGDQDGFISKMNGAGSKLLSSSYIGGSSRDEVTDLITDHWGNVYVTGNTLSEDFPITVQAEFPMLQKQQDIFFMHINTHIDSIVYSSYVGTDEFDIAGGIGIDFYNNLYIAGIHDDTKETFLHIASSPRTSSCFLAHPLFSIDRPFGAFVVKDPLKNNAFRTIPNNFSFLDAVDSTSSTIQIEFSSPFIAYLQMILNTNPRTQLHKNSREAGFEGEETTYFGYYTKKALEKFQILHHIAPTGLLDRETAIALDQCFIDLQKKPIKLLPKNWVVEPLLVNDKLQIITPNFKEWYIKIQDPTDETVGWINVKSYSFSLKNQSHLATLTQPISPSVEGKRGGRTEKIIATYIQNELTNFLPDHFPAELSFALIVHESYPDAYHFDNSLVTFDAGRGIQQITTNAYVGSGLGLALFTSSGSKYLPYWHCYEPGLPVNYPSNHNANTEKFSGYYWTEAQCLPGEPYVYWGGIFQKDQCIGTCIYNCALDTGSRIYTNTPLGIQSNIADGFVVLQDKLAATSPTEECFPIAFSSPFFEQHLSLSEEDVRYISSIQRYHGYFRFPQNDPNSYLYAISLQLQKIGLGIQNNDTDIYWFSKQFTKEHAVSFLEWAEKVKYVFENNIETF